MYFFKSEDEWNNIHPEDLWVYNKLFLSRVLGYVCGPVGTAVPKPDFYIIRPSFNLLGMIRFTRIEWIESSTDHYHPSEFWCEIFNGDHLSIDFHNKEYDMAVLGIRDQNNPIYKWDKWEKVDRKVNFPEVLLKLKKDYEWINCEFIGDKLIEVQFRRNPDFRYNNTVAIPEWNDRKIELSGDYRFIKDEDYNRTGFWVK